MTGDSALVSYFRQADRYHKGRLYGAPIWVVIHDMEAPETQGRAKWCIDYFANNLDKRDSSVHYAVDDKTVCQGVLEADTAWQAPGANARGIGIENAGYASQDANGWLDTYSKAMLENTARLTADICKRRNINPVQLSDADLKAGKSGIITHAQATRVFNNGKGHTDPGPNFPWAYFLGRVKAYYDPTPKPAPKPTPAPAPKPVFKWPGFTLKQGDADKGKTGHVRNFQQIMRDNYSSSIVIDGIFGPSTTGYAKSLQRYHNKQGANLVVDGVVGPATQKCIFDKTGKYL